MFTLPKLPYDEDALAPHISARTMALHYRKHHKAYVDTLNKLLVGDTLADSPLEEVIDRSRDLPDRHTIFNNAAQAWNHDFFWKSMKPDGGGAPSQAVGALVGRDIGGVLAFNAAFNQAAASHFGSGWLWLVLNAGKVEIIATHDADLPLVNDCIPLLVCDLWEHAYYLDYENRRAEFVQVFLDHLVNWDFANINLELASEKLS